MKIDGIEVIYFSDWDGLPVKNHLPEELRARMKTENQWLEEGFVPRPNAPKFEMHPSSLAKKTCVYYLNTDVQKANLVSTPKNCMTCNIRTGRYCVVAGGYVGARNCCSEWTILKRTESVK